METRRRCDGVDADGDGDKEDKDGGEEEKGGWQQQEQRPRSTRDDNRAIVPLGTSGASGEAECRGCRLTPPCCILAAGLETRGQG